MQINVSHLCEWRASCLVPFSHTCLYTDVDLVWMSGALDLQSWLDQNSELTDESQESFLQQQVDILCHKR